MSAKTQAIFVLIFAGILVSPSQPLSRFSSQSFQRGVNGGATCVACTVIVALTEQLSEIYNETAVRAFDRLCNFLPVDYQIYCQTFGSYFVPLIIDSLEKKVTPDVVCHGIGLCYTQAGKPECTIFPPPKGGVKAHVDRIAKRDTKLRYLRADICDLPGVKELCEWIKKIFDQHDPALDADGDYYSIAQTLRGVSWRGKDCDDSNPGIHPGAKIFNLYDGSQHYGGTKPGRAWWKPTSIRRPIDSDIYVDSNCNGIYGVDGASGTPYEDLLCGNSSSRGVAILGDSVGAHFHLPEEWFDSSLISVEAFKDLTFILENEIDWPEFSAATGYKNSTYSVTKGPTHSMYHSMWERNRCNHRDYQNIAVNGARSSTMLSSIVTSLARNPSSDTPLLIIYALIGNDVCNGHPDTFAHMTTPEEMRESFTKTLQYLETHVPTGSHIVVNGLVDGRILFNNLHDRIHPIGRFRNDVTYSDFYDYLYCLEVSPCNGWLTSNETVRDKTTERAKLLNSVLKNVSTSYQSQVFDVHYFDFPIEDAIKTWEANGGEAWQLIEPVDGFHTNQYGQALTAQVMWDYLQTNLPDVIGEENPHNSDIQSLFGDQGGYE